MSGLNLKKFRISDEITNSLKEGKVPLSSDLDKAISDSEEGDSDG
jgi:hypothetical protein